MELYIHIPFCRKKCRYCSFTSFAGQEAYAETYVSLILEEAAFRRGQACRPVRTVYLGGGTPSLLPPDQLVRLTEGLRRIFSLEDIAEFTTEANPGTLTKLWLDTAVNAGISRLSLGVQSTRPELLRLLGRIHAPADVRNAVRDAREAGIRNLNLDLIFGIPGQTMQDWSETVDETLSFRPEHISAYGLIPEEGTPLWEDLEQNRIALPDPELERDMYDLAIERFSRSGLQQYEISNFALPGYECRHNVGYWMQEPYLGLGVSAVSMDQIRTGQSGMTYRRLTNPSSLEGYRQLVRERGKPSEETIMPPDARFETMMLGLRMNQGVSEKRFENLHGMTLSEAFGSRLDTLEKQGLIRRESGYCRLTRRGFDIQNTVLVELMDD